jgi:site-specific recombinase XerD
MSDFEKQEEQIRKYNQPILEGFYEWLQQAGLSRNTIKLHLGNIHFFADYLFYYEPFKRIDEADDQDVYDFLSDFFPRKALWASESNTKSYMTSFKKFFLYMVETNKISPDIEAEVKDTLKECKQEFLDAVSD